MFPSESLIRYAAGIRCVVEPELKTSIAPLNAHTSAHVRCPPVPAHLAPIGFLEWIPRCANARRATTYRRAARAKRDGAVDHAARVRAQATLSALRLPRGAAPDRPRPGAPNERAPFRGGPAVLALPRHPAPACRPHHAPKRKPICSSRRGTTRFNFAPYDARSGYTGDED